MADYSAELEITAAATVVTEPKKFDAQAVKDIAVQSNLDYGSGGTTIKVFVQTSLDEGDTWTDIICHAFTTSDARKGSAVKRASARAEADLTDGSLSDDTEVDGLIGDRIRFKVVSAGTYADTTLNVDATLG